MIASYLLVIDTGPSWKQADEGFSFVTFSKLHKSKAWLSAPNSSCGCVGWNAVCHVGWASPCHLLQQVNSAEAQGWWSLKWTGTGATFPGLLLPGEPSVSGSSWCSAFHRIPVFQPHSWFLLTTRELHITQRSLPSMAKAAFKIPASLLFPSVLLTLHRGRKNIPLLFLCLLWRSTLRWQFTTGKSFILNETSACVYWWPLVAIPNC